MENDDLKSGDESLRRPIHVSRSPRFSMALLLAAGVTCLIGGFRWATHEARVSYISYVSVENPLTKQANWGMVHLDPLHELVFCRATLERVAQKSQYRYRNHVDWLAERIEISSVNQRQLYRIAVMTSEGELELTNELIRSLTVTAEDVDTFVRPALDFIDATVAKYQAKNDALIEELDSIDSDWAQTETVSGKIYLEAGLLADIDASVVQIQAAMVMTQLQRKQSQESIIANQQVASKMRWNILSRYVSSDNELELPAAKLHLNLALMQRLEEVRRRFLHMQDMRVIQLSGAQQVHHHDSGPVGLTNDLVRYFYITFLAAFCLSLPFARRRHR